MAGVRRILVGIRCYRAALFCASLFFACGSALGSLFGAVVVLGGVLVFRVWRFLFWWVLGGLVWVGGFSGVFLGLVGVGGYDGVFLGFLGFGWVWLK